MLTERTAADSLVLYRRSGQGWSRSVIEPEPLHIEAGGVAMDVDGDGNLDYIAAGDWQRKETVPQFMNLFIETGGTAGLQFGSEVLKG